MQKGTLIDLLKSMRHDQINSAIPFTKQNLPIIRQPLGVKKSSTH